MKWFESYGRIAEIVREKGGKYADVSFGSMGGFVRGDFVDSEKEDLFNDNFDNLIEEELLDFSDEKGDEIGDEDLRKIVDKCLNVIEKWEKEG